MLKQYLEAGKIVGTHGIRGEMRFDVWCDGAEFLKTIKTLYFDADGKSSVGVESIRPHGNVALLKLNGLKSIDEAEKLRNKVLFFDRSDVTLAGGKNFVDDILGCTAVDADNETIIYGIISDVIKGVANDIWSVKSEDGKETLIPVVKSIVIKTEPENGKVYLRPIKGLFSDEYEIREDNE